VQRPSPYCACHTHASHFQTASLNVTHLLSASSTISNWISAINKGIQQLLETQLADAKAESLKVRVLELQASNVLNEMYCDLLHQQLAH